MLTNFLSLALSLSIYIYIYSVYIYIPYTQIPAVLFDMIKESYTYAEGNGATLHFLYQLICHKCVEALQRFNHVSKI